MAPARTRSLAIAACCALSGNVLGQGLPPLRVDPALLGLTPLPAPRADKAPAVPVESPPAVKTVVAAPPVQTPAEPLIVPQALPSASTAPAAVEPPAKAVARLAPAAKAVRRPAAGPRRDKLAGAEPTTGSGLRPAVPAAPLLPAPLPVTPPREERRRETRELVTDLPAENRAVESPPAPFQAPQPPQILRAEEWDDADREPVPAPGLRLASALTPLPAKSDDPRPAFITADRMQGINDRESSAEGAVELRKVGTVINSDRLIYRHIDDEVEADGNVVMRRELNVVSGPRLRMRMEEQTGAFESPEYVLRREPPPAMASATPVPRRQASEAQGKASLIEFQGENQFQLTNATYSTCKAGDDSWFARVANLHLDYDREVGEGRDATVFFKGVPIMYTPWLSFSLNNQRKSGFLPPTFGSTSQSGSEMTLPYYWNIAPNMDATIAPRIFTKRGVQINSEFRYLSENYNGTAQAEWLPGDKVRDRDRWGYTLTHGQNLGYGFYGNLNLNGVSDDFYYRDLSSRIANSAQALLVRQGALSYGSTFWSLGAQVTKYQTLQPDPANPVARPYEITPQINLNARRTLADLADVTLLGQYTSFTHPDRISLEARRTVLYPQVSVPFVTPAFSVTPKLGVHMTRYGFNRQAAGVPSGFNRSVPIMSVDSNVTFERPTTLFGQNYTQTLEPRLYYLYVPNRDQSVLTNNGISFDSGVADLNFAQIFSENLFTGHDRIADANQLTAALSTRFLDPDTGAEYFKAMVGQRLYFSGQAVTLNAADARRTSKKTDLLAAATGRIFPKTYADAAWQYNPRDRRTERLNFGARYQPETGHVLNASYRYGRNQTAPFDVNLKQFDVSGQWPLFGGWQGVGRFNYSLNEKRIIETIAGLEYNSGCWAARVVVQRFATTATTSTSAVFFQLELSDFSRIGSNPLELLKRSIPGYGQVDQPAADPAFGTQK